MPTVRSSGIEVYYEEHGSGEPLLLIMGWAGNAATWKPQIPGLAERYRVIAFDNRGVGRTEAPDEPYSIRQMADDAVGLLDALQVPSAHVFGISMGGMIAQELALAYPERVGALVLGCTSSGGSRAAGSARLKDEIADFQQLSETGLPDLQWFSEFLKRLFTDEALARSESNLQDFVLSLIRFPPTPHGMRNQSLAIAAHDAYDRLPQIRHPTLVITGDEDSLIHPENSALLADRIPNAELRVFHGLKHAFHLERPDLVNSLIIDFIESARRAVHRAREVGLANVEP
jgi:pimeloyl-ACP methyl ester carboxylesterase